MITAENERHGLGVEQGTHRLFGIGQAALGVGVDHIAVAGIDNSDFVSRQIGDLVFEIKHAFRPEAVEQ